MQSSARHSQRLSMGVGAVLTVNEAAALLPVADSDARLWLRRRGLVSSLDGRPVVVWAAVLAAIRSGDGPDEPPAARRSTPLPRVALDPL